MFVLTLPPGWSSLEMKMLINVCLITVFFYTSLYTILLISPLGSGKFRVSELQTLEQVIWILISISCNSHRHYIFFFPVASYSGACFHIGAQGWLSVSWSFTGGRTPWTGDQLVARPLPKHRKTWTHIKHSCPAWDSNPQSRPPSDRGLFMPQTARLPRPAGTLCIINNHIKTR
jgi:hypothetical protein